MKRRTPDKKYLGLPCSAVAVGCAYDDYYTSLLGHGARPQSLISPELDKSGYLTLDGMNRLVRAELPVQRKISFKRGQRPTLSDYVNRSHKKAVVCVTGHFLYADGINYYSYFENDSDEVVCVWELK